VSGRLDGKVAVVTGASTGIGGAVLKRFAAEGASVVAVARNAERLEQAVKEVVAAGGAAIAAPADLSSQAGADSAVDAAVAEFGGVDVLVNNAGVGYSYRDVRPKSMEAIADAPVEEWDHVMDINLGSVVHCTRRVIPEFRKRGGGAIVNVASVLGLRGQPDAHAYTAAKGAIINLTRSVAITYAKENIRCNVVCPGYIETNMVRDYIELLNSEDYRFTWNPSGRMGKVDEIANGVLFLASDEASYTNGTDLVIDGGLLAKAT
jgi:NAD(P)-dependent dehydrogenase (short-subunit alcohol dehydrogenase family)